MAGKITFKSTGSFQKTEGFLNKMKRLDTVIRPVLESAGREGVQALIKNTPRDSGIAAESWGYEVRQNGRGSSITWTNSNVENGFPVAIMLQYGHGTGTGGYVQGQDYINPAMRPVFDKIASTVWKAVTSA